MKKKILLISAFFHPEITPRSFRATELAKEFSRRGYDVLVLLPFKNFDYTSFEEEYSVKVEFLSKTSMNIDLPKQQSVFAKAYRFLYYKMIYFFEYPYIKFLYQIPRWFAENREHFNIIISIAYPHPIHWGVSFSKINCDLWVADCGDPYIGDRVFNHPSYFTYFENRFLSRANYIIVPLDSAIGSYNQKYKHKFKVIPQGFAFPEKPLKKTRDNKVPTFAYCGSFYKGYRDPTLFLKFLCEADESFVFIIYANLPTKLKVYTDQLYPKVIVKEPIPRESLLQELSQMDFLINFENPNKEQSPSKLIDYSISNRPILSISSDLTQVDIKKWKCFVRGDYRRRYCVSDIKKFDIKNVANSFIELIK